MKHVKANIQRLPDTEGFMIIRCKFQEKLRKRSLGKTLGVQAESCTRKRKEKVSGL